MRAHYSAEKSQFENETDAQIIGNLARLHEHDLLQTQTYAWIDQLPVLRSALLTIDSYKIYFEFEIPRMGRRADVVIALGGAIIVIEFKSNDRFEAHAIDQVEDYALDLKTFHSGSHDLPIIPILIAMRAKKSRDIQVEMAFDLVAKPICLKPSDLVDYMGWCQSHHGQKSIDFARWEASAYRPTPTIIEAAKTLYARHDVGNIKVYDAGAQNLALTDKVINEVVDRSKSLRQKSIIFVTGVPGAGKTLVGLNIASTRADSRADMHAMFLSGNGPLVDVLREALIRDEAGRLKCKRNVVERKVKAFIQPIHVWRDDYLKDLSAPADHIVVFDESQRAWTREKASSFMRQKKGVEDFDQSEPEFLLGVMDRHQDWCTVVCLVGGGQEINTGEAGITEWLNALTAHFPHWHIYVSSHISHAHYDLDQKINAFLKRPQITLHQDLHLNVSMRSFRAETVSEWVSSVLDHEPKVAKTLFERFAHKYEIVLTRDINQARHWLKQKARGSQRYGFVASSGAHRLKPEGLHLKAAISPEQWFLNDKDDVRSSFALEDAGTEFDVQGLELDWVGVCWDADLRQAFDEWGCFAFKGTKWQSIHDPMRRLYLKNAYRVILTRARQGMVIFIPRGDENDPTRPPSFYQPTYDFLRSCGVPEIGSIGSEVSGLLPETNAAFTSLL